MRTAKTLTPTAALAKLQDLCARSEQCSFEVITRLRGWGIDDRVSRKILLTLKRDRYVDDARFAEAFVRDKVVFNRWGRRKIHLALIAKHIDAEILSRALDTIDGDEYRRALDEVLTAKARTLSEVRSYESRMKLVRHAVSRGFETALISERIKQLFPLK